MSHTIDIAAEDWEDPLFQWRIDRAHMAIDQHPHAAQEPELVQHHVAIGIAVEQISPHDFEQLLDRGCPPLLALDILR